MKSISVKITNPSYLHRQMATKLQQIAGKFTCDVDVVLNSGGVHKANAKSLINLMSLYAKIKLPGKIEIIADHWTDESDAIKEIAEFFGVNNK